MVTMHDVMDAQWMLDNHRDGECPFPNLPSFITSPRHLMFLCGLYIIYRGVHATCSEAIGSPPHLTQENSPQGQCSK